MSTLRPLFHPQKKIISLRQENLPSLPILLPDLGNQHLWQRLLALLRQPPLKSYRPWTIVKPLILYLICQNPKSNSLIARSFPFFSLNIPYKIRGSWITSTATFLLLKLILLFSKVWHVRLSDLSCRNFMRFPNLLISTVFQWGTNSRQ